MTEPKPKMTTDEWRRLRERHQTWLAYRPLHDRIMREFREHQSWLDRMKDDGCPHG